MVTVACLGDVMLDVLVRASRSLVPDDDVPAQISFTAGGQAANVAAWVCTLGGKARLFGPTDGSEAGSAVRRSLEAHGVEVQRTRSGRVGTVVSVVVDGTRSLASDLPDVTWLDEVAAGGWLDDVRWLFVSGYALLRSADPTRLVQTAAVARAMGTRVAVDLASASMIRRYGARAFSDLCGRLRPEAVFATDDEWATHPDGFGVSHATALVLKHGAAGATFRAGGVTVDRAAPTEPVDVTGAGDALAAGYLIGGVDLAMEAAARCVAQVGAQPPPPARPE